jgi:hypothetical protein
MITPTILLEVINTDLQPGDEVAGAFAIPEGLPTHTESVEFSILWHTSGKGTEDLNVLFYREWKKNKSLDDLPSPYTFTVRLPQTPWSYDGELIKIHWLARVRLRYGKNEEAVKDVPFMVWPR